MSKPLALAGASALSVKSMERETELLLNRQRKKGPEYKLNVDAKKRKEDEEYLRSILGELEGGGTAPRTGSPVKQQQPGSPKKGEEGKKAPVGGGGGGMDAYDPKAVAQRELDELTEAVTRARVEASKLKAEREYLDSRYETLKCDDEQFKNMDTVEEDRNKGLDDLMRLNGRLGDITKDLGETEQYSKTLLHMLRRSEGEKLDEMTKLKAYEEGVRVHRNEVELAEEVQRQVNKARDEELRNLARLHTELRKAISTLDKKLEFRRAEVKTRQEKAKWRLLKLAEEQALTSAAEGLLTPEQEMAMVEKARANAIEAESLRAEKMAAMAEADQLEGEFNVIRFAAGGRDQALVAATAAAAAAAASSSRGGGAAAAAKEVDPEDFVRPDPEPVIARLAQLEEELVAIDETLKENSALLAIQVKQRSVLDVIRQPRARDSADEEDRDVEQFERLQARIDGARKAAEGSARDLEAARSVKLHLEQSLTNLFDRVSALPISAAHLPATPSERAFTGALRELEASLPALPTTWTRNQVRRAMTLMEKFHVLMHVTDPDGSAIGAQRAAQTWERTEGGREASSTRPTPTLIIPPHTEGGEEGEGGGEGGVGAPTDSTSSATERSEAGAGEGAPSTAAAPASIPGFSSREDSSDEALPPRSEEEQAAAAAEAEEAQAREAANDRLMDATIESLLVSNEWSVRVRPGSSGPSRPFRSITGKNLGEAVAAFERTWRGVAGAPEAAAAVDPNADPFATEAAIAARKTLVDDIPGYGGTAGPTLASLGESVGGEAKSGEDNTPLDPASKPKARDIQRFLAVAAAMVGDEIEEGAIAPVGGVGSNQARKDAHKEKVNLVNLRDKVKLEGQAKLRAHELEMARRAAALAEEELKASKGKR